MKKAQILRQHLLDTVKHLERDPDRLIVLIKSGRIAARAGSLSFEYRYDLTLVFTDYADHADTLIVPLMAWLSRHQPDLLQNPDTADNLIRFEAEILDHKKSDVEITIQLSERVIVTAIDGHYEASHCDEPPPLDLSGPAPWEIFVHGEKLNA